MDTYMSKLWNVNETSQIFEIRTFIVEFPKTVMLTIVAFFERLQNVNIICP